MNRGASTYLYGVSVDDIISTLITILAQPSAERAVLAFLWRGTAVPWSERVETVREPFRSGRALKSPPFHPHAAVKSTSTSATVRTVCAPSRRDMLTLQIRNKKFADGV